MNDDYPELIKLNLNLKNFGPSNTFRNENLFLGNYGTDTNFIEYENKNEFVIDGEPPEELKNKIIKELENIKEKYDDIKDLNLTNISWEFTILNNELPKDKTYVELFFNDWLVKDREEGFNGDSRKILVGIFNAKNCLYNNSKYISFDSFSQVTQHIHMVNDSYEYGGKDNYKLNLSNC